MKLLRSLVLIALSSVLTFQTAHAAEKTAQTAQKQTTVKEDKNLKEFNRNVGLSFTQRGISTENGKTLVHFTYEIENKSNRKIKTLTWGAAFIAENKIIFAQEVPLTFDPAMKPKTKETISMSVPLETIPEESRAYFLSQDANISALNVAKVLVFTNGKKIQVK